MTGGFVRIAARLSASQGEVLGRRGGPGVVIGTHSSAASRLDGTRPQAGAQGAGRRPGIPGALRLSALCALLMGLPFVSSTGDIIADTKLDMAIFASRKRSPSESTR